MAVSGDHEEDEQNEDQIAGDDGGDAHTGGALLPLTLQQKRLRLYPSHLPLLCFLLPSTNLRQGQVELKNTTQIMKLIHTSL